MMMKNQNSTLTMSNSTTNSKLHATFDENNMENNTTKAKYPNPSLTRSRSILLKENSKSPPCITVGLRPQLEVFESANPLELKVIFLGEPLPLISWKKDNIPLSETMIKSKLNCSTLFLASVNAESDAGLYSCTVENSEGKVETRCQLTILSKPSKSQQVPTSPTLTKAAVDSATNNSDSLGSNLKPSPPIILDHLKCVQAEDGSEIELSCKIVCPPCSFDVVWIHNGKEIKPSKDFQYHHVDSRYTLKIPELFPEDAGVYTCEAFNDYGETFTTCSLYVTCPGKQSNIVDPATAFKTFPKSISVARGGPVVVQAELGAGCDRQVSWTKDGCVIDQTTVNDQNKVQFSIVEAGVRDTGLYELHATMNKNENDADPTHVGDSNETTPKSKDAALTAVAAFAIIVL